ncbi:methyltransferase domain-containing protein [Pseudobdellovibrio exovorus]|uniref:Protein arginine N-methyltransferase domain-containing protein n=1 Tax=Pseudobdellovibrio exovorus JSS TaxID=1184267 RepID=M4V623_9BACT|nr:class I SAM-dependent methyltransferase [Pseudobdellovibrio exovorus]AGH94633.1 hypothetical protein A11Q_413 [Pseudobdellovibrio exovorus JSS]
MASDSDSAKKSNDINWWEAIDLHKIYLSDYRRNEAYQSALQRYITPESVVVDIGCGTGILGFMALKAGARKLYAIEQSNMIHVAREVAERNQLSDRIEFIQGDLFELSLPENADIILHDQIGDFFWDEGMVEKLAYARAHFLKPQGKILPQELGLHLVPAFHPAFHMDAAFWKEPFYGIDFSTLHREEIKQSAARNNKPLKIVLKTEDIFLSSPQEVAHVDFLSDAKPLSEVKLTYPISKTGWCTGLVGFFQIIFDQENILSTSPLMPPTNWAQFLIPVREQIWVEAGQVLNVEIQLDIKKNTWDCRVSMGS